VIAKNEGSVVVTGSVAFDYLMRFPGRFVEHLIPDRLARLSVSFLVDEMRRVPGGCACNIAYGLALLGERPLLFASAGHDAAQYRDWLAEQGVDVSGLRLHDDVFTASFFVSTDDQQNQIASFYTGAMARARDLSLSSLSGNSVALVIVSPNDPLAMRRYAGECRALGLPFLYDPSQQVARLDGGELVEGLTGAWILVVNDYEFGILTHKTGLSREQIESRVPVVVITHGPDGSTIAVTTEGKTERQQVPSARLEKEASDPTGVGDAYRAGLVRGARIGAPWAIAGRLGSVSAVLSLEAPGPQPPRYRPAEFRDRYVRSYGEEPWLDRLFRL
jgi:adenosine kinase